MSNQSYEQSMESEHDEPNSGSSMHVPSDCDDFDLADDGGDVVMCSFQDRFNTWREYYSGSDDNEGVLMEQFLDEQIASTDPDELIETELTRAAMLGSESPTGSRNEATLETSSQSIQTNRPVIPITQVASSVSLVQAPSQSPSYSLHPPDQATIQHVSELVAVPVNRPVSDPVYVPVQPSRPPIPHYPPYQPRTFPSSRRLPNIPDHPTVFLLRGVSGSGKSTVAERLVKAVHKKVRNSNSQTASQSSNQRRHSTNDQQSESQFDVDGSYDKQYEEADDHPERSAFVLMHRMSEESKHYFLDPETDSFVYMGPPKAQPTPAHSTRRSNSSSNDQLAYQPDVVAVCSADDYFIEANGNYNFDVRYLSRAHNECMGKFLAAIDRSVNYIIIDNTHSEKWEYANYQTLARMFKYELIIIEMVIEDHACLSACVQRASHGVQWSISLNLFNRWQTDENSIKLYPKWSSKDKDHILRHDYTEYQKAKQKFIAREHRKLPEQLWNNQVNNPVNSQFDNQLSDGQSVMEALTNPVNTQSMTNPQLSLQSSRHHIRPKHVIFNNQSDQSIDPVHSLSTDQQRTQSNRQNNVHSVRVPVGTINHSSTFSVRVLPNDAASASQHSQSKQSFNKPFDSSADISNNQHTRLHHKRPHSPTDESVPTNRPVDQSNSGPSDHQPPVRSARQPHDRSNSHRSQSNNQQNSRSNGRAPNQPRSDYPERPPRRPRNQANTQSNDQLNTRSSNQSFAHSENQSGRSWNRQTQPRQQRSTAQSNDQPTAQHQVSQNVTRFMPRQL